LYIFENECDYRPAKVTGRGKGAETLPERGQFSISVAKAKKIKVKSFHSKVKIWVVPWPIFFALATQLVGGSTTYTKCNG